MFELQRVEEICQTEWDKEDLVPWDQIENDLLNAAGYVALEYSLV